MSHTQSPDVGSRRTLRSGVRNPRRRPRPADSDSIKTAPRRKRSKIDEETFVPPRHDEQVNGTIEIVSTNGDLTHTTTTTTRGRSRKESVQMHDVSEMPLRSKKTSLKRPVRTDGATILTQTERYSIRLLPSTPKELRREGMDYRGSLGPSHQAVAVTREHAYIWDYTSHTAIQNPRVFSLPFSVKPNDPLPFAALVTSGASSDMGLVLVSATTGKVFYHESIERAASLGLFQDQSSALEGPAPGFWAGESVVDLQLAEHLGGILTLSSGRILHFTLRDAQGRVNVSSEVLRAEQESSGGLFGSIKGYLSAGGFKRDVTAVRTRSLDNRGKMQIIALTEKAELQIWDLEWNGQASPRNTIDFRDLLVEELKKEPIGEAHGRAESFTALDFAIMQQSESGNEIATPGLEKPILMLVLARVGRPEDYTYLLAEMSIEGREPICSRLMDMRTYRSGRVQKIEHKPQLLLPTPQHTAVLCHQDAFSLLSLESIDIDGPDAQLQGVSSEGLNFEDTAYLRTGNGIEIMGAFPEETKHQSQASIIAFIKNYGVVRISAVEPTKRNRASKISPKTLIEQAVFHGALQETNFLDFSRASVSQYLPTEIERAALAVSQDILQSTSPYISTSPTSMEAHLAYKADALQALVTYVRQSYPTLSKSVMWKLLWDAERVAAGRQIWKAFEEHVAAASHAKRTATTLDEVCALIHAQDAIQSDPEQIPSNTDETRDFLIHGLDRIEKLFTMTKEIVEAMQTDVDITPIKRIRIVEESCDLWVQGLEAVFRFRSENAGHYGIVPDFVEEGILSDLVEFADLPEFWTSTEPMQRSAVAVTNSSRETVTNVFEPDPDGEAAALIEPIMLRAAAENPRLIQITCLIYQERINWLTSRGLPRDEEQALQLKREYEKTRHEQIRALANIAQTDAGFKIAEKYHDMETLTEMIVAEMQFAAEELATPNDERRNAILRYMEGTRLRIGRYFDRFGDDWANAYFDVGFSNKAGIMLKDGHEAWQDALTRYLRADPSRAKICWINDLIADNDYVRASRELVLAGKQFETRLWNRKVELSMAKLATLAAQESLTEEGKTVPEIERDGLLPEHELTIVGIQENLYNHLYPEIVGLIDHQAEMQEVTKRFGWKNQDLHSLRQILYAGLERVLDHDALSPSELIDVFTLMDVISIDEADASLNGSEFFLALRVLNAAAPGMSQSRVETLLQLIWKRCYVYDDWISINSAQKQSGEDMAIKLSETMPWRTLYFALAQGLLIKSNSRLRILMPSECLGAGCLPEDLSWRFPDPDLLDPILHDNKVHDEQLQGFIDDRRLDSWIETILQDVQRAVSRDHEETSLETKQQTEFNTAHADHQKHRKPPTSHHLSNGVSSGANGHLHTKSGTNGIKVEDYGVWATDDGSAMDVEMDG